MIHALLVVLPSLIGVVISSFVVARIMFPRYRDTIFEAGFKAGVKHTIDHTPHVVAFSLN